MIKKYNTISLAIGIPAILMKVSPLLIIAVLITAKTQFPQEAINFIAHIAGNIYWIGSLLLFVAIGFYAASRKRSVLWSLLAIFGLFGLIALLFLTDRHAEQLKRTELTKANTPI